MEKNGLPVGDAFEPRLTVDGIRNLLLDMRTAGQPMPQAILVSEYDRRELNQDLMGGATETVAKEDQRPEHDGHAIAVIEGVLITSHPDVGRGKAALLFGPHQKPKPGTGKIISLGTAPALKPEGLIIARG